LVYFIIIGEIEKPLQNQSLTFSLVSIHLFLFTYIDEMMRKSTCYQQQKSNLMDVVVSSGWSTKLFWEKCICLSRLIQVLVSFSSSLSCLLMMYLFSFLHTYFHGLFNFSNKSSTIWICILKKNVNDKVLTRI
jgi:hypothetical protein